MEPINDPRWDVIAPLIDVVGWAGDPSHNRDAQLSLRKQRLPALWQREGRR